MYMDAKIKGKYQCENLEINELISSSHNLFMMSYLYFSKSIFVEMD